MRTAFYGQVLVRVGDALLAITLPATLYQMYLSLIGDLEKGIGDTSVTDLARHDAHDRIRDWFACEYPHIPIKTFDAALERRVEADIVYHRRNKC